MTTNQTSMSDRSPEQAAQIAAFRVDPPLRTRFPLTLSNGAAVPALSITCTHCHQPIDSEWVRGRVYDSLPTLKTVDVSAYCVPCHQFYHVDTRFRAVEDTLQVECTNGKGAWVILRRQPDSLVRKLLAKAQSLFGDGP